MRESSTLEFKSQVTKSFLKTVSAYANFGGGTVVFGVADDGEPVGLEDPIDACLRIETMINDSIVPAPRFELEPDSKRRTVTLTVAAGRDKPYLYRGKAFRRSDSATVEADSLELRRLVLEGSNTSFDALDSAAQGLAFSALARSMRDRLGVGELTPDVMRTLGLASPDTVYNNAAALLADANDFPGVDIMRFGESVSEIRGRTQLGGLSLLEQFSQTMEVYEDHYAYEVVSGTERERRELVPREALREAVANALVHRAWDVPASISVAMFPDRIVVTSPGGLPSGMTRDDYLRGLVSVPRNPILAEVFFRLGLIEKFGTGIPRIVESYAELGRTPSFDIGDASISIELPVASRAAAALSPSERAVAGAFARGLALTRQEVSSRCGFDKDKTLRLLNALVAKGVIRRQGSARSTRYVRP